MGAEVNHRMAEECKVHLCLGQPVNAEMSMFDGIVIPTMLYGYKARAIDQNVCKRVDGLEIKCFRGILVYGGLIE